MQLYQFYYKIFKAKDDAKKQKQIDRIESLISEKSLNRYHQVEKYLVPLLTRIVRDRHVDKSQIDSVVVLYSDYDHFSGSSLFSQLLSEESSTRLETNLV